MGLQSGSRDIQFLPEYSGESPMQIRLKELVEETRDRQRALLPEFIDMDGKQVKVYIPTIEEQKAHTERFTRNEFDFHDTDLEDYIEGIDRVWCLDYGSKSLTLNLKGGAFHTVVTTNDQERKDNETTILYTAARTLMQQYVDKVNKTIEYVLTTSNPNMMNWAKGKGSEVFNWDLDDYGEVYASTWIRPSQQEPPTAPN